MDKNIKEVEDGYIINQIDATIKKIWTKEIKHDYKTLFWNYG